MKNNRVQVGNMMTFSDGIAWFSPCSTNSSANAAVVKNGISGEEDESKFVGTGQRRLRTEFVQEAPKNTSVRMWLKVFSETGYICDGKSSVQWDWLHMWWEKPHNLSVTEANVTSRLYIEETRGRNMKHETKGLLSV